MKKKPQIFQDLESEEKKVKNLYENNYPKEITMLKKKSFLKKIFGIILFVIVSAIHLPGDFIKIIICIIMVVRKKNDGAFIVKTVKHNGYKWLFRIISYSVHLFFAYKTFG